MLSLLFSLPLPPDLTFPFKNTQLITLIDVNYFRQHDLHFPFLVFSHFSVIFHQTIMVFVDLFLLLFCFVVISGLFFRVIQI